MEQYNYFPSLIYRDEKPHWVKDTLINCEKYYKEVDDNLVKQTDQMVHDPDLQELASYFRDSAVSILKEQSYMTDEYEFYLSGMWGQEFAFTGSNIMHVHGDSQISGFFFLKTEEGGSYPMFDDPRSGKKMTDLINMPSEEITLATPQVHFNNVIDGTVLFFNSWLPHMLTPNMVKNPTKFIHFIVSQKKRFVNV